MTTEDKEMPLNRIIKISAIVAGIGLLILFFGGEYRALGSIMVFTAIMLWVYRLLIRKMAKRFQAKSLVRLENWFEKRLTIGFKRKQPLYFVG